MSFTTYLRKPLTKIAQAILFVFAIVMLNSAFAGATDDARKKIGILVFDGVLTSDVTAPIEVFGAATKHKWFSDYEVVVVSSSRKKTIRSEEGLTIVADTTIYHSPPMDILIVGSAYDMTPHLNNHDLISYIKSSAQQAPWMASNCSGAFLLGEAGVLDGKRATTWAGGEKDLAKAYPKIDVVFDTNVVEGKRVITSNGGPVSYEAAFALLEKLSSKKRATEISEAIQFNRLASAFK